MTGRFVLSPRAQTDLDEIWNYTADRWGLDQAETYTRDLWQHIGDVAAHAATGQECSDIREGYHKISCHSHVIFYRRLPDGIDEAHRQRRRYRNAAQTRHVCGSKQSLPVYDKPMVY